LERFEVTDQELMALMHAELDGDLSSEQRAALARLLLSDPRVRALRDELRSLSNRLDVVGQVEPPTELKDSILRRLPSVPIARAYRKTSLGHWRLAAMVAGLLIAGTIVYETVQGPAPGSRDIAGTIAADSLTAVDSVAVGSGPVTGRATLYRDKSGLAVGLEVSAAEPVDVFIATPGYSTRIKGLGTSSSTGNARQMVALPGVQMQGQDIELSFLIGERTVSRATLHAPSGP
jgi:anti-sigma factor RsiW